MLNRYGTGNRTTYIDFYSDDSNAYGLRIIRGSSEPQSSTITHKGTGNLRLVTESEAPIQFLTSNSVRMTINPDGKIVMANQNISNVADPVNDQDAATKAYVDKLVTQLSKAGAIVADADGNIYSTVRIGSQVWMGENLKTTKYNNGAAIPNVTDNEQWRSLPYGAYCWYNNDRNTNGTIYGALYNWNAVETGRLCPLGWHVPSEAEWTTLITFLGGEDTAGGKMKTTTGWKSENVGGTNASGFSALPGGYRHFGGAFEELTWEACIWSSTKSSFGPKYCDLVNFLTMVYLSSMHSNGEGHSVRCIRDN